MKKFDLNIEKILESWELCHAIREIIANALDEQLLTQTKDVCISQIGNAWIIRDYGRGLKYTHLTQNENQEKIDNGNVIGKFGIGLKDALATFDRKGVIVTAKSKHNIIRTEQSTKQGFHDVKTLHAVIKESHESNFVGTEFELIGVSERDIDAAKNFS
ncbi:ATP-binding protein [Candidatus Symbiobacter mobilis]|nr:ATP-binding protein [Candidatus Symbiobacter mobilis]